MKYFILFCQILPLFLAEKVFFDPYDPSARFFQDVEIRACFDEVAALGGKKYQAGGVIRSTLSPVNFNDSIWVFADPKESPSISIKIWAPREKPSIQKRLQGLGDFGYDGIELNLVPVEGSAAGTYEITVMPGDALEEFWNRRGRTRIKLEGWSVISFAMMDGHLTVNQGEKCIFATLIPEGIFKGLDQVGIAVSVRKAAVPVLVSWSQPCEETHWKRLEWNMNVVGGHYEVSWRGTSFFNTREVALQVKQDGVWSTLYKWSVPIYSEREICLGAKVPIIEGAYRLEVVSATDGEVVPLIPYRIFTR